MSGRRLTGRRRAGVSLPEAPPQHPPGRDPCPHGASWAVGTRVRPGWCWPAPWLACLKERPQFPPALPFLGATGSCSSCTRQERVPAQAVRVAAPQGPRDPSEPQNFREKVLKGRVDSGGSAPRLCSVGLGVVAVARIWGEVGRGGRGRPRGLAAGGCSRPPYRPLARARLGDCPQDRSQSAPGRLVCQGLSPLAPGWGPRGLGPRPPPRGAARGPRASCGAWSPGPSGPGK